jgi:transaldolase
MTNSLLLLQQHTVVVADTGDLAAISRLRPRDATTNPSLILKAAQKAEYRALIEASLARAGDEPPDLAGDHVLVGFGTEILRRIDGRVSTEVDAQLSFDVRATLGRARRLIALYEAAGVDRERVLIKIAATWEGIRAAEALEREGIHCNLTLLFSLPQAQACADAGVTLISPFVGRIYDWFRKQAGPHWDEAANAGANDPGVRSVRAIFERLKSGGYRTEIMGASFRNTGQVLALAGCDLLTISPELLDELAAASGPVPRMLTAPSALAPRRRLAEPEFRQLLNDDVMASEKLAEGIRVFIADARKLDALLARAHAQGGDRQTDMPAMAAQEIPCGVAGAGCGPGKGGAGRLDRGAPDGSTVARARLARTL